MAGIQAGLLSPVRGRQSVGHGERERLSPSSPKDRSSFQFAAFFFMTYWIFEATPFS